MQMHFAPMHESCRPNVGVGGAATSVETRFRKEWLVKSAEREEKESLTTNMAARGTEKAERDFHKLKQRNWTIQVSVLSLRAWKVSNWQINPGEGGRQARGSVLTPFATVSAAFSTFLVPAATTRKNTKATPITDNTERGQKPQNRCRKIKFFDLTKFLGWGWNKKYFPVIFCVHKIAKSSLKFGAANELPRVHWERKIF